MEGLTLVLAGSRRLKHRAVYMIKKEEERE